MCLEVHRGKEVSGEGALGSCGGGEIEGRKESAHEFESAWGSLGDGKERVGSFHGLGR